MQLECVSDAAIAQICNRIDVRAAVSAAFCAAADGTSTAATVLRVTTPNAGQAINLKFGTSRGLLGGKLGTYWVGNRDHGLPNHAATTILFDPLTGFPRAILSARLLNRLRTAAGDAVAVDALARTDATILALIGAGEQSAFEARAIARVRGLTEIRIAARSRDAAAELRGSLADLVANVVACSIEDAVRGADLVVTATSAREPLVTKAWISPGTHISAMGADAVGKQELDPAILKQCALFADLPEQARIIGEAQHCDRNPVALGAVLSGAALGRQSAEAVTVFDSCGIAAQDLHVAEAALMIAREAGLVQLVEW